MYKNKKERKKEYKEVLLGYVFVCVVTSTSSLVRLIYVPPENYPQNEEHSRRLVTVQLILQQIFCLYLLFAMLNSLFTDRNSTTDLKH